MEDYINQKLAEAAKKTKKAQLEAQKQPQAHIQEKKEPVVVPPTPPVAAPKPSAPVKPPQNMEDIINQKLEEANAKKKAEFEAKRKAAIEVQKKGEEAKKKAEEEAKKKAETEAKKKAELEAKKKAETEAKKKAELEAKKKAELEAKKKAELEAKKKAEEEAKKKAEVEAKKKAEEEAKKKAEVEAKKKAEEEAKKKAELEAKKKVEIGEVPSIIFIVPYRDRSQQQGFFARHMKTVMEDIPKEDYKIYYIHQTDKRDFNRGAMKNIGFLMVKDRYPEHYKNITLVFNDVDTMPYSKNFLKYTTTPGVVKHFYGYKFALGGIVSITGGDFEKTLGFPNFWAWGYEDNTLKKRVDKQKLTIDYKQFYPIMDKNILQLKDGLKKIVNRSEFDAYMSNSDNSGHHTIKNLTYEINEENGFVNVKTFETEKPNNPNENTPYDIRQGTKPFKNGRRGGGMRMAF